MTFLASIPIWVYFVILAVTFMVVHVLALRANQPKNRLRSVAGQVGASILLLMALVFLNRNDPATVLIALIASAVAGFISGRTATPQLPPRSQEPDHDPAQDAGVDDEAPRA